jgi:hypothetical protein
VASSSPSPDAQARALRGGERRRREGAHLLQQRLHQPAQVRLGVVVLRRDAGDVPARAEGAALSPEQQRPHLTARGGGSGVVVRLGQIRQRLLIQRVQLLRGVEDHFGDAVGNGKGNHGCSFETGKGGTEN